MACGADDSAPCWSSSRWAIVILPPTTVARLNASTVLFQATAPIFAPLAGPGLWLGGLVIVVSLVFTERQIVLVMVVMVVMPVTLVLALLFMGGE